MEITGHLLDFVMALVIAIIVQIIIYGLGKMIRRSKEEKGTRVKISQKFELKIEIFRVISFLVILGGLYLILSYLA